MARTCKANPSGGPITVLLLVNNGLISGGNFKIYEFETGIVKEEFKIQASTIGSGSYVINFNPANLIGHVLSWQVLTCSPIVTNGGTLKIEIFQDGSLCETDPHATYHLKNVPNCSINQALPVQGGLHFLSV